MEFGHYSIEFDRTGFPLIQRSNWDYSISLFPVSKYQFKRFMVGYGPKGTLYTDQWYRELLRLNPRCSWRRWDDKPWELFITGVSNDEINPFLKYLGPEFRLPKVKEWTNLLEASGKIGEIGEQLRNFCSGKAAPSVECWIEEGLFPLVKEGLLEMVLSGNQQRYLGRPYQGLLPNTWTPETVRDVNWEICRQIVGFRVVKGR